MKSLAIAAAFLFTFRLAAAQEPLLRDAALKQLYNLYDAKKGTAQWICPDAQKAEGPHAGWQCLKEYSTVSVDVLLIALVQEGATPKTYLITSAEPAPDPPEHYDCHACAPAIGLGVFAWRDGQWVLESANAAAEFYGGWGRPPGISLVNVGPARHGVVLSSDDMGQGYAWSAAVLLVPLGKTASAVWSIDDERDDAGAFDPTDKWGPRVLYRSSAAFKFCACDGNDKNDEFYGIEVISRGSDQKSKSDRGKPENWTEIYTFKEGKYRLARRTNFVEVSNQDKKAHK
jgi:hypothetical protein